MDTQTNIGLYLHVPFCRRKCRYCDFFSRTPKSEAEMDRFIRTVAAELRLQGVRLCAQANTLQAVETIYLGGGTPSMLGPERLGDVLRRTRDFFDIAPDAEVTVEANPLDVTPQWAEKCLQAGFNRISIGVQSVAEDDLRFLGRLHRADDGPRAAAVAHAAGFKEIGIDLIYGLPGQTREALRERVCSAIERCRPQHVSCYQLTYAEGTPLRLDADAGLVGPLSEDEEYDLFVALHAVMAELGYPAYEVSNFSLGDAHRSRHNSGYWLHSPYIGLGPSAHSFVPPVRSWNVRSLEEYFALTERGSLPAAGTEELSEEQLASETVMLALRTCDGLDVELYRSRFGRDFLATNREALLEAEERGWLTVSRSRVRPTLEGLAIADTLAAGLTG